MKYFYTCNITKISVDIRASRNILLLYNLKLSDGWCVLYPPPCVSLYARNPFYVHLKFHFNKYTWGVDTTQEEINIIYYYTTWYLTLSLTDWQLDDMIDSYTLNLYHNMAYGNSEDDKWYNSPAIYFIPYLQDLKAFTIYNYHISFIWPRGMVRSINNRSYIHYLSLYCFEYPNNSHQCHLIQCDNC